jgi:hopanoid-associated phosphorylase
VPGFVIAATGLGGEARIAARSAHVVAVAGGGDGARLATLIHEQIAQGGRALISFGICAGLAPGLPAGTCLVGREAVHGGAGYATDTAWAARIRVGMGALDLVTIAGVDRPLIGAADKKALRAATGAAAADMESHIVARIAKEHRLPFAVLRAVADPAERNIPAAALKGMRPDGSLNVGAVLGSLAQSPGQLPALLRVASDTRRALAALLRCHDLLGPGLGFGDLG